MFEQRGLKHGLKFTTFNKKYAFVVFMKKQKTLSVNMRIGKKLLRDSKFENEK